MPKEYLDEYQPLLIKESKDKKQPKVRGDKGKEEMQISLHGLKTSCIFLS